MQILFLPFLYLVTCYEKCSPSRCLRAAGENLFSSYNTVRTRQKDFLCFLVLRRYTSQAYTHIDSALCSYKVRYEIQSCCITYSYHYLLHHFYSIWHNHINQKLLRIFHMTYSYLFKLLRIPFPQICFSFWIKITRISFSLFGTCASRSTHCHTYIDSPLYFLKHRTAVCKSKF
jgi:hypothetical protein